MILHVFRTVALGLVPVALTACVNPGPAAADRGETASVPLGADLGSSASLSPPRSGVLAGEGHERTTNVADGMQMAHEGHNDAHATGTVNTVDPAQHKLPPASPGELFVLCHPGQTPLSENLLFAPESS
jgi:hypothetical protein